MLLLSSFSWLDQQGEFDLDFFPSDAVGFVPVKLCGMDGAIG